MIKITDSGNGISKEYLPNIFIKHKTTSKENLNCGLGLAFVKKVIDEHKAEISVISEKNKGSSFSIKWPIYQNSINNKVLSSF